MRVVGQVPCQALCYWRMPTFAQRLDAFWNRVTRLGGYDKRSNAAFIADAPMDVVTLDNLYHFNTIAAIICDVYPQEALRMNFEFKVTDDLDLSADVKMRAEELGVRDKVKEAATWGRVFGGGCIFMGVDDGQKVDRPLDYAKIKGVKFLSVYDRRDFTIVSYYTDPLSPNFNQPEFYRLERVNPIKGVSKQPLNNVLIHESRLVWFRGTQTSRQKLAENNGWHFSCLQRPYEVLRDFEMTWAGAALLLQEAGYGTYKVKNLLDILAAKDGVQQMQTRMAIMDEGRSTARSNVVDADGEDFTRQNTTFTGIPDMLDRFASRLAASVPMPVTRLMGTSPSGLNATGESDVRFFYDRVQDYRESELQSGIERICRALMFEARPGMSVSEYVPGAPEAPTSGPGGGSEPEWCIEWPSLYVQTDKEKAETRKIVADTDAVYINAQVVTPEEIAACRFGEGGYSMDTTINLEIRETMVDELTADDVKPPEPDPVELEAAKAAAKAGAVPKDKGNAGDTKKPVD